MPYNTKLIALVKLLISSTIGSLSARHATDFVRIEQKKFIPTGYLLNKLRCPHDKSTDI